MSLALVTCFRVLAAILTYSHLQAATNQMAPMRIAWPVEGQSFSLGTVIKIKTEIFSPSGTVKEVQFFADTNLIASAYTAPFDAVWRVTNNAEPGGGIWKLKVVATDQVGSKTESPPVAIGYHKDPPTEPIVEILQPANRAMFALSNRVVFSTEVLASFGGAGPVELFLDGASLGTFDKGESLTALTPPRSVILTNIIEGEHGLTVRFLGVNGYACTCNYKTNVIRVVKLGIQNARLATGGRFESDVITSYPGKPTIVQKSSDLVNWTSCSTNVPSAFSFTFSDIVVAPMRWYRVILPP
jgi:hypothetical protein